MASQNCTFLFDFFSMFYMYQSEQQLCSVEEEGIRPRSTASSPPPHSTASSPPPGPVFSLASQEQALMKGGTKGLT